MSTVLHFIEVSLQLDWNSPLQLQIFALKLQEFIRVLMGVQTLQETTHGGNPLQPP